MSAWKLVEAVEDNSSNGFGGRGGRGGGRGTTACILRAMCCQRGLYIAIKNTEYLLIRC
jgi:hypothetical protein